MKHFFLPFISKTSSLLKIMLLLPFMVLQTARGEVKKESIQFDLTKKALFIEGVFSQPESGKKIPGLEAEIAARKEALQQLTSFIAEKCSPTEKEQIESALSTKLKSVGSEIFPNGALKIRLILPFKALCKKSEKEHTPALKDQKGKPVVFALPKVAARHLECFTLTLKDPSGQPLKVWPLSADDDDVSQERTRVNLVFNASGELVIPNQWESSVDLRALADSIHRPGVKLLPLDQND